MPDSFSTQTFIAGDYQSPYFTSSCPGPFAPPAPCPNLCFVAGNPVVLSVVVPTAGGTLLLSISPRGDPSVNLLAADGGVSHTITATADDADLSVDNTLDHRRPDEPGGRDDGGVYAGRVLRRRAARHVLLRVHPERGREHDRDWAGEFRRAGGGVLTGG